MKLIRVIAILCLVASIFSVVPAKAQDETEERLKNLPVFVDDSRKFEISLSYVLQGTDMNLLHIEGAEDTVNVADLNRGSLEFTAGYFFDRKKTFGVEFLLGYTWALGNTQLPIDDFDPDNPVIFPIEALDHSILTYGGNIIWNFGYLDIVPFLSVGFGVDSFSPSDDAVFPLEESYYHTALGLGFKYYMTEWFGVRVQVDDYFFFIDDEETTGDQNQFRLKIGAIYTF